MRETKKTLKVLAKIIESIYNKLTKSIDSTNRCYTEIPEVKIKVHKFINYRNDQYKDKVSKAEGKMKNHEVLLQKDITMISKQEKSSKTYQMILRIIT